MSQHEKTVKRHEADGWQMAEHYPSAKTTILVKDGQQITIKRGRVCPGYLPPQN